jgi:chromosome segregation ATPase
MELTEILALLTETAPLVLAVLILAGVVLLTLYASIKVIIPALRETVEMFEAQRTSWRSLIDEQRKFNGEQLASLEERIVELETQSKSQQEEIERLQAEDRRKAARITELEAEIEKLRAEDKKKSTRITELEAELQKVQAERDELRHRLDALEKVAEKPAETASVEKK